MGCKDAVLPESLSRNHSVNCLTYEQNTKNHTKTIFAFSENLLFTCMEMRNSKKKHQKLFNFYLINSSNPDPSKVQGVCLDDIPSVEDIVRINIFIYDIDPIDIAMVGELARRSIKNYKKNVQLIRYNSQICYVDKIHALFKALRCPTCET